MTWLASVQTAADGAPTPLWLYALSAFLTAAVVAAIIAVPSYLDSDFHRRRVARVRRLTTTPRRTRCPR